MKKKSKVRELQRVGRGVRPAHLHPLRDESAIDRFLEFIYLITTPNVEGFRQAFKDAVREVVAEQVRDAVKKVKLDKLAGYDGK